MIRRLDLAMVGLLAAALVIFFWDAILLRGAFFVQDVMVQNYPFRDFYSLALKQWTLPLWHPGINCGFPLFAEGQAGVLYPFNLLTAILLPTFAGITLNVVAHLWLGAVGTYWYLRILKCVPAAALAGGLTYGLSGFLVVRAMSQNYIDVSAWVPFLFVLLELAFKTRKWTYLWGASAVVGLQFLAGHPQATAYAVGAAALYGLYRAIGLGATKQVVTAVAIGMPLLGVGLAAIQLLPTFELVQLSGRSEGLDFEAVAKMSLPPERLVAFLLPNAFGNPSDGSYWGRDAGFFIQLCPYIGVLPLLLALIAVRERRDGVTLFFLVLCGAAVILALGSHTGLARLLYDLPGWSFFRIPTRFLAWVSFGGAVLAGLGMDWIFRGSVGGERGRRWTVFALAIPVVTVAALNRHVLLATAEDRASWATSTAIKLWQYRTDLWMDLGRCALMLIVGYLLCSRRCIGWRKRAVVWLVPILIFADLYSFGAAFNGLIPVSAYQTAPDSAVFIRSDIDSTWAEEAGGEIPAAGLVRTAALVSERNSPYDWHSNWALDQTSYQQYPGTLRMYTASLYGLANTLPGWSPLHLRRHWQFTSGYPSFMNLANVGYVISYSPLSFGGLELAHDGDVRIYRNHGALPRAYIVPWQVTKAGDEALGYMRSHAFDPHSEVVVEGAVTRERANGGEVARFSVATILSYEPERVEIDLGNHRGGMLVLTDSHYPGWRARVDGVEAPVLKGNYVFRTVAVGPEARRVIFEYDSASFVAGAWASALAAAALVVALLFSRYCGPMKMNSPRVSNVSVRPLVFQVMLILLIHGALRSWPYWSAALERCAVSSVWPLAAL